MCCLDNPQLDGIKANCVDFDLTTKTRLASNLEIRPPQPSFLLGLKAGGPLYLS